MTLLDRFGRKAKANREDEPQSPVSPISRGSDEKHGRDSDIKIDEKASIDHDSFARTDTDEEVQMLNGEPVVTTGRDVSRYVVDIRDDGEAALTFRSLTLGTVFAGLGAALCQVRICFRASVGGAFVLTTFEHRYIYLSPYR